MERGNKPSQGRVYIKKNRRDFTYFAFGPLSFYLGAYKTFERAVIARKLSAYWFNKSRAM